MENNKNYKMNLKKTLISLLGGVALISLVGCAISYIPERKILREIEKSPYHSKKMNCCDKAIKYHKYLKSKGYISQVVSGKVEGIKENHAWVEVFNPNTGKNVMIDPTWIGSEQDKEGYEVARYSKTELFNGCYPKRSKWFEYYDDVTKEDMANGRYCATHRHMS